MRLRAMERDGQLVFNKFKQYELAKERLVLTGKVIGHRDGYGFFVNEQGGKDLFISSYEMQRVIHGDIVEAIVDNKSDRKGRKEVRILNVIEPRKAPIVGRIFIDKKQAIVKPEDARIQQEIIIPLTEKSTARHGQIVAVELLERPSKRRNAIGKVVEVLGDHQAPGMEIQIALREHDLPHVWPEAVLEEANQWAEQVPEEAFKDRIDLRHLPLVTIDGEDARDFDDAVYCERKKNGGWRLWVAIADVSYYVRPGSAIDDEAIIRGNSVYFPSQVIPMLPEKLSNGLCSLNPDVNRLCFVCEMTISEKGKLSTSKFYPAVMKSHARLTYTQVGALLDGDETLNTQLSSLVPHLTQLHQMYFTLVAARKQRGAIEFETVESKFIFNEHRKIESIEPVIRNDAHKIIEECMILANVATAKFVAKHQEPALYRVHDKPNEEKYNNFIRYLAELGIELPKKEEPEPADYGKILAKVAGRPDQELIQTMLLRSMKQAVYQHENIGHFGLALPAYSHFTSPIRRYPDLIIHRVIKAILEREKNSVANIGCYSYPLEQIIELGENCSMTERRADEATRDVADWLKCEFMQDHVGTHFNGVISTVTNFGFFVRLTELHIEGLVHISSLGQDYYQYDELRMCLVGENTHKRFHVGDSVEVQVAAVNLDEKKIDLLLSGNSSVQTTKQAKNGKKKNQSKAKSKTAAQNNAKPAVKEKSKTKSAKKDKTVKSKVKKRTSRKKRPGKNERKLAKAKTS
jgi:ribonuclease R